MGTIKQVVAALIVRDDKILICQRTPEQTMPLKWEFPGGKIEPGETPEACLIREIKEELNVTVKLQSKCPSYVHQYPDFSIELIPFTAFIISGEIALLEHAQYKWLEKSKLNELDWAQADVAIVQDFLKT